VWFRTMNPKKSYVVFKCPNCGFYSLAFEGQKTRLCVRCEKTVKIDHLYSRRIEGFEEARSLLSKLNLNVGQGSPSCSLSVIETTSMRERFGKNVTGRDRRKGSLRAFQEDVLAKYMKKEVEVSELLQECEKVGVPREYADKLIRELVGSGQAYHPRKGWIRFL